MGTQTCACVRRVLSVLAACRMALHLRAKLCREHLGSLYRASMDTDFGETFHAFAAVRTTMVHSFIQWLSNKALLMIMGVL